MTVSNAIEREDFGTRLNPENAHMTVPAIAERLVRHLAGREDVKTATSEHPVVILLATSSKTHDGGRDLQHINLQNHFMDLFTAKILEKTQSVAMGIDSQNRWTSNDKKVPSLDQEGMALYITMQRYGELAQRLKKFRVRVNGAENTPEAIARDMLAHISKTKCAVYLQTCAHKHVFGNNTQGGTKYEDSLYPRLTKSGATVITVWPHSDLFAYYKVPEAAKAGMGDTVLVEGMEPKLSFPTHKPTTTIKRRRGQCGAYHDMSRF